MAKETVLVSGGAGFIGSHVVEALLNKGCGVTVLDNFATGSMENLEPVENEVHVVNGDIRSIPDVKEALAGVSRVVHLAALPSVPRSIETPLESHANNVDGTLQLLEAARAAKVKRFVFAGSSAVYGDAKGMPRKEAGDTSPLSPYAVGKLAGEAYALLYHRKYGLPVVCLRFFNVYGPRQDPDSPYAPVVPRFLSAVSRMDPFPIYGDGQQQRDFTYVGDVVQAVTSSLFKPSAVGNVINIGGGRPCSVQEVARLTAKVSGVKCQIKFLPPRQGDVLKSQADLTRARKLLGFAPRVPMEEGLSRTAQAFKEDRTA